jgi:hypothetical protein
MTERLLQFIWQFQYFNKAGLITEEGEPLHIIHAGTFNNNQGPDFIGAKLKINDTIWAGNIELHINSSHWQQHKHSTDKNYKNVVLHVVWQHDADLNLPFQTLVLQNTVPKLLLEKYEILMQAENFIPCGKMIEGVNALTFAAWKQRLLVERLLQKSETVFEFLKQNNNHWEETFWWLMAKNFGAKVNSDAFEKIARSVPINILAKHKNQIHQIEGLLFGQAGLLQNNFKEDYPQLLQREYNLYKAKYRLKAPDAPLYFLRMRPANFPTVRLAQLAMLVHQSLHLFSKIKESKTVKEIKPLLNVTANDYWHYRYVFDEPGAFKKKNLGTQMTENILINTVAVILFAYGQYHNENNYKDKALQWLEETGAEKNAITKGYMHLNLSCKTAFDSQALIQLKNNYCSKKRCLDCAVGNSILKNNFG